MALDEAAYRRAMVAIVLLAVVLRLIGLNWDGGRGLHPDEGNLVRAALTLGIDGRLLPEFHAYNDLALWVPRLLSLPFCESTDAACLTLTARVVSAGMSLLMVPLGADLARRMGGLPGGLAAALALAVSAPLVQWAHFGTTESTIAVMVLALWWVAARWQSGEISDRDMALWSGVIVGVGFGFKTTALVVSVIPLVAFALAGRPDRVRLGEIALFAGIAGFQGLVLAPSVLFAAGEWLEVMRFENGVVTGTLAVFWTAQFTGARDGIYEIGQLWSLTSGAGLLLALVGLVLMPRAAWRIAAPGLVLVLVYAALTFDWHAKFVRYLAPIVPVVLVFAGVAVGRLAQPLRNRAALAAALAGLGLMVMAGLDSASAYLRPDPRIAMEARLLDLAASTDVVAIEPYDLAQLGGLPRVSVPLDAPDLAPQAVAEPLARAEWLILASRRNWEVLPRQPGASPVVICAYYAGLSDGSLGYVPALRIDRAGALGHLFAPGLGAEETRVVFDRPEVFLFRNIAHLPPEALAERLSAIRNPADCAAQTLQRVWRRGP